MYPKSFARFDTSLRKRLVMYVGNPPTIDQYHVTLRELVNNITEVPITAESFTVLSRVALRYTNDDDRLMRALTCLSDTATRARSQLTPSAYFMFVIHASMYNSKIHAPSEYACMTKCG